jgi:hypothetical protein
MLPQNFVHRLTFCELVNQLVQVSDFLHERICYFFHPDTTHDAFDERGIRMNGGGLSEKSSKSLCCLICFCSPAWS